MREKIEVREEWLDVVNKASDAIMDFCERETHKRGTVNTAVIINILISVIGSVLHRLTNPTSGKSRTSIHGMTPHLKVISRTMAKILGMEDELERHDEPRIRRIDGEGRTSPEDKDFNIMG